MTAQAFEELWKSTYPEMLLVVMRQLGQGESCRQDAEDACQDAAESFLRDLDVRTRLSPRLLIRRAVDRARNTYQRNKAQKRGNGQVISVGGLIELSNWESEKEESEEE